MGVNTLAFRMAQHNRFFAADADCVPLTGGIPWELTRQWLDLVARSGTALFVSVDPAAITAEQRLPARIPPARLSTGWTPRLRKTGAWMASLYTTTGTRMTDRRGVSACPKE